MKLRRKRNIISHRSGAARPIARRTCVSCRQTKAKRGLMRLVRTPEGEIEIDSTGKKAGRGAYLCPTLTCWEAAFKGNKLEHSLHVSLTRESRKHLMEQGKDLMKKEIVSG